ncbi:MAG: hypothetical protein JWM47_2417 [Acidimicrobiales bacterium]|nr:hypothetical protein [Acidimicrobiales bacterium]
MVGLVGVAVALSACSAKAPDRTELTDALERTGMGTPDARCVSDAILDTLTDEQVAAIVERGPSGAPVDPEGTTDGPATKVREAIAACKATVTTTTVATTLPSGDAPTSTTVTPLPGTGGSDGPDGAQLNPASTSATSTTTR